MLVRIYPENPNEKHLRQAVQAVEGGGIIAYPTDTVYALGCDLHASKTIERLARLKGLDVKSPEFSLLFSDISMLSEYTVVRDNAIFKLMKRNLPGPFTFILQANHQLPRLFRNKRKTVGVRIPDNPITLELIRELGKPLVTTSVHDDDEVLEYTTDPELIYEKYQSHIELLIHGGYGNNEASTVVDCTGEEVVILRRGMGELEW